MRNAGLKEEKVLWKKGFSKVAGVDEVGRGPLAGPVFACSFLILKKKSSLLKNLKVRDSKRLSPKKREELYKILTKAKDFKWGIGKVSEKVIDRINILKASKLAMKKSLFDLEKKIKKRIDFLILDGNFKIDLPLPQKAIIKGDDRVFSCAAASIIAKVARDRFMRKLHKTHPHYRFDVHKGYPTKLHLKLLKKHGRSQVHRASFGPVAQTRKTITIEEI